MRSYTIHAVRVMLAGALLLLVLNPDARAFDPEQTFSPWTKAVSLEGGFAHFSSGRLPGTIQAWDLGARVSVLPFGVNHFNLLEGVLDGALEMGLEPTFARFESTGQNFGGLGFDLRYNLMHFTYGPFVPWIEASIAPGGSDLRIGKVSNETRLTGPFLALIRGEAGVSYFVTDHTAVYVGLQAEHFSNGGFNGSDTNYAINTPWGGIFGVSWYFH